MGSFPLSALWHSFIFFPFVPGTFLSPPCLPWPWGQRAGRDAGLNPRSQDNGPQAQEWVGEWEVLHPGSSGCFAYPGLCLTCLFPHLFPQLKLML